MAVERNYVKQGSERETDFINVVAWRQTAEFVCKYFSKGQLIALDGTLQTRSYKDRDGNNDGSNGENNIVNNITNNVVEYDTIKIDSLEKAKNAPCIFNNWANFSNSSNDFICC